MGVSMSISLTEDLKTMTELERHPEKIVDQIHETGRPVVITKNGKPDLVILDAASYERHLKTANLAQLLADGEADVKSGRTQPYEEFIKEFRRAKKISN
jgi:prevent-host-death family protein